VFIVFLKTIPWCKLHPGEEVYMYTSTLYSNMAGVHTNNTTSYAVLFYSEKNKVMSFSLTTKTPNYGHNEMAFYHFKINTFYIRTVCQFRDKWLT